MWLPTITFTRVTVEPVLDMHQGEGYIEAYALAGEYKAATP